MDPERGTNLSETVPTTFEVWKDGTLLLMAGLNQYEKDPDAPAVLNFTLKMTLAPGAEEIAQWHAGVRNAMGDQDAVAQEAMAQAIAAAGGAQAGVAAGLIGLDWLGLFPF